MVRRTIYLGLAMLSAWQFITAVQRYRLAAAESREKSLLPPPIRRQALR